ncbi:MAG: hypothetical protein HC794_01130 [Nitrospiraceae bacterium]|nr:hypothetical protein [Nitrospiraceae bacterium]
MRSLPELVEEHDTELGRCLARHPLRACGHRDHLAVSVLVRHTEADDIRGLTRAEKELRQRHGLSELLFEPTPNLMDDG